MLLLETTIGRISEIPHSARPMSWWQPKIGNTPKKLQSLDVMPDLASASFGSGRDALLVLVVGADGTEELRRFAGRYGAEVATVRHADIERVYVPASWLTGLASQGVDVGEQF